MELTLIKEQLEDELKEAQSEKQRLDHQLDQKPDVGLGKGSTGLASWQMAFVRKDKLSERIDELQKALKRVNQGNYGKCDRCGGAIDDERLEILPTATLCMECASRG